MTKKSRSLYIYGAENWYYALWYRFTQFMARVFPPHWVYEVWERHPGEYPDDWVGGSTVGYYLHQAGAEAVPPWAVFNREIFARLSLGHFTP